MAKRERPRKGSLLHGSASKKDDEDEKEDDDAPAGTQVAMADTRDPDRVKISVGYEIRNGVMVKITGYASGRETIRPVKIK